MEELKFLGHPINEKEATMTVWEVDDDIPGLVQDARSDDEAEAVQKKKTITRT